MFWFGIQRRSTKTIILVQDRIANGTDVQTVLNLVDGCNGQGMGTLAVVLLPSWGEDTNAPEDKMKVSIHSTSVTLTVLLLTILTTT